MLCITLLWLTFPAAPVHGAETTPALELRDLPLLFADDGGVASRSGVFRTVYAARQRREPVLEADKAWEGSRVYVGSVYWEEATGRFTMWYYGNPDGDEKGRKPSVPGLRKGKGGVVTCATSNDGLHWEKPSLGQFSFQGSKENNIVFDLHSPSVLVDASDPDPARRFKMLGTAGGGYFAAISPDGMNWTSYPDGKAILNYSDNICLTQDPATGDYLAYARAKPPKVEGRSTSLSRSKDFKTWSKPQFAFAGDAEDDTWSKNADERTEVNNMAVMPHAGGFVGFPAVFRVLHLEQTPQVNQSGTDGLLDAQLVTSEDGQTWKRTLSRTAVIARGEPGTFDSGAIFGVSTPWVRIGDETWVYYTGMTLSHGAPFPPRRMAIGRAEWRLDGFASLDAGEFGRVETKPLRVNSGRLLINANATGGELRAALLEADGQPISGYSLEESETLSSNSTHWPAKWKAHAEVPADRPVRVVLSMKQCRLFSLAGKEAGGPKAK